MNRVADIEIALIRESTPDGQERLQRFYDSLIKTAIENLERIDVDKLSSNNS